MSAFVSSLAGRIALAALLLALLAFGVSQCRDARNSAARVRVSESQAGAALDSGADAVGAVGAVSGRNSATDKITMENADAIADAPGANAPVDPALRDAVLAGLCRRTAYSGDTRCMQFTPAGRMAGAGAGGAAAGR